MHGTPQNSPRRVRHGARHGGDARPSRWSASGLSSASGCPAYWFVAGSRHRHRGGPRRDVLRRGQRRRHPDRADVVQFQLARRSAARPATTSSSGLPATTSSGAAAATTSSPVSRGTTACVERRQRPPLRRSRRRLHRRRTRHRHPARRQWYARHVPERRTAHRLRARRQPRPRPRPPTTPPTTAPPTTSPADDGPADHHPAERPLQHPARRCDTAERCPVRGGLRRTSENRATNVQYNTTRARGRTPRIRG